MDPEFLKRCRFLTVETFIDRTKRVKEARDDAKKEISDYKSSKEDDYKKFEAEVRWGPHSLRAIYASSFLYRYIC